MSGKFVRLAAADERPRRRRFQLLRAIADDFGSGSHGEFRQFIQRIAHLAGRATFQFGPNEENPFGSPVRCRYERFQLLEPGRTDTRNNRTCTCAAATTLTLPSALIG